MTNPSRQFILKILIFTLLIYTIATVLFNTVFKTWYFAAYSYQILLFATITTISHLWTIRSSGRNARQFTTVYMASVTLKLFGYLIFMLVYLLIDHSQAVPFALTFITFYTFFTVFEVIQLLNFIKKQL